MRLVAILNQKGGVGKTTTAANLGAALALRGRRVLLIDLDPQGNLTDHLGVEIGEDGLSVYDVLTDGASLTEAAVATGTAGLHLVPSHEDLAGAELELAGEAGRELRLRHAVERLGKDAYDYVLVDCPPSLGLLSLNAMAAVTEVLVALQTEYFALRGMTQLQRILDLVRRKINPDVRLAGILATLVDPVTNLAREVTEEVREHFGDLVFKTRIRKNVRLAEAPGHQRHIFDYAPDSTGAKDYRALAEEVEARAPGVAVKPGAPAATATSPPPKPPPHKPPPTTPTPVPAPATQAIAPRAEPPKPVPLAPPPPKGIAPRPVPVKPAPAAPAAKPTTPLPAPRPAATSPGRGTAPPPAAPTRPLPSRPAPEGKRPGAASPPPAAARPAAQPPAVPPPVVKPPAVKPPAVTPPAGKPPNGAARGPGTART